MQTKRGLSFLIGSSHLITITSLTFVTQLCIRSEIVFEVSYLYLYMVVVIGSLLGADHILSTLSSLGIPPCTIFILSGV